MVSFNATRVQPKVLALSVATIFALLFSFYAATGSSVEAVGSSTTVKIYGDTSTGENQPGWLFNRDLSNTTPIEFNTDLPSIGNGSLYVLPVSSTEGARKFIGENFIHTPIADVNSISYDFAIGSGGEAADENEFYLNVYANFGNTAANKYYDCKYDVVPSVGVVNGFTTVTFDPTLPYPVTKATQAWNTPIPAYDCPAIPAEMDLSEEGSFIRMFAINLGDTSLSDADLDGYFDNVVVDLDSGTTVYDFEPAPNKIPICHRTNSVLNPYTYKKVNHNAIDGQGNNDHSSHTGDVFDPQVHTQQGPNWGDIIPPVHGLTDGMNWTERGQEIWEAECSGRVLGEQTAFAISASKVVCVHESFLPNWGAGGPAITETTAQDFVDQSEGACQLVDWEFQWAPNTSNPGNQVEEAGDPWTTFSDEVVLYHDDLGNGNRIWVREVFSEGWVEFSGANKTKDVSAELYCGTDVLNYDNYDYIQNPKSGETYHCVGFNAPQPQDCEVNNSLFRIGDDETDQLQHPADELSWNGAFGNWDLPTDDPFVVPFSPDKRFVWNSNTNAGQGTDFEVMFYISSPGIPSSELTLAWGPGRTGNEVKEVYLDGTLLDTLNHTGTSVSGWFERMQIFDDTVDTGFLAPGWHTLRLTHTSGDGTLWDFVDLSVTGCDWDNEIQGRKFRDVNADGVFSNSEKNEEGDPNRLDDWNIYLFDEEWNQVDMMVTGDDGTAAGNVGQGQYRFVNVAPGTYYVCEAQQYGWTQTNPSDGVFNEALGTYCFTVEIVGNNNEVNSPQFGNFELGRINGLKFIDENRNGEQDEDESLIEWDFAVFTEGWEPVRPHHDNKTAQLERVVSLVPDSDLEEDNEPWSIWHLKPGDYIVCEEARTGWVQTHPSGDAVEQTETDELEKYCHEVTIDESGEEQTVTFGNYPVGVVQGRKFQDVNGNGEFDDDERIAANRLDGWVINLYNSDWDLVDSMETGDDTTAAGNVGRGQYRFVDVPLGTYYVCEEQQEGWIQSAPSEGPQFEEDITYCHEVNIRRPGQRRTGRLFGNYQPVGQIQGLVYNDVGGDSTRDVTDPELEGWDIWLMTQNSPYTVQDIFTTGSDGTYSFDGLAYGRYWVCQGLQEGWRQTQLNNAGTTGVDFSTATIGSVLELDDTTVATFCYEVELTSDNQVSLTNDFGNQTTVQGITIEVDPDEGGVVLGTTTDGQVLGDSDVLAETGQGILISAAIGSITFLASVTLAVMSRPAKLRG